MNRTGFSWRLGALVAASALCLGGAAQATEFRWATQTDPSTMDPHATNIAPVLGFLNNVYEGLVRRGKDMAVEPALAASWEALGTEGWRFNLRRGGTFQLAEAALPRAVFAGILNRINSLRDPPHETAFA